jgi:ABC-type Fe3+/spermidine/putrescine transport system ATPase subunit
MIIVESLTKNYGARPALKRASLALTPGEILAVVGPSGSGKTTLLRLIAGFERPDGGKIEIDGVEVSTPSQTTPPHTRKLSLIFQDLALWPHMSVIEHIEFVLKRERLTGNALQSKTRKILSEVALNGYQERYPHQLSGGEKQRLAIARAIASDPRYLLMDEPLSNVDTILKEELQELMLRLKTELQVGILYVTHIIEEALAVADTLAIMNEGRIVQIDKKENLVDKPEDDFVRRFLGVKK